MTQPTTSLTAHGGIPDARLVRGAQMTTGSPVLSIASAPFTAADVGKVVVIGGAGPEGRKLRTTIVGVVSPTEVDLAASALTTVPNAKTSPSVGAAWGTDCSTALKAMLASFVGSNGGTGLIDGDFLLSQPVTQSYTASFTNTTISLVGQGSAGALVIATEDEADALSISGVAATIKDLTILGVPDAGRDARRVLSVKSASLTLDSCAFLGLLALEGVVRGDTSSVVTRGCNFGGSFVQGFAGYTYSLIENHSWFAYEDYGSSFIDYGFWRGIEFSKSGFSGTRAWVRAANPNGTLGARQESVFKMVGSRFDENTVRGVDVRPGDLAQRIHAAKFEGIRANVIDSTQARGIHCENVDHVRLTDCAHGLAAESTRLGAFINCGDVLIEGQKLSAAVDTITARDVGALTIKDSDPFKVYDFERVNFHPVFSRFGDYAVIKRGAVSDADFPYPPAIGTRAFDRTANREYVKKQRVGGWVYFQIDGGDPFGPELVTNGRFVDGVVGWTAVRANLTNPAGKLRVTNASGFGYTWQSFVTEPEETYQLSYEITAITAAGIIQVGTGHPKADYHGASATGSATFRAVGPTAFVSLTLNSGAVGAYAEFDNISIKAL
jgi:hypothetical protein